MNWEQRWNETRDVYSLGILALGAFFALLAVIGLCVLPWVLRIGKQLADALTLHARALSRGALKDDRLEAIARDVRVIKGRTIRRPFRRVSKRNRPV